MLFIPSVFNTIFYVSRPWSSGDRGAQVLAMPARSLDGQQRVMAWNVGLQRVI